MNPSKSLHTYNATLASDDAIGPGTRMFNHLFGLAPSIIQLRSKMALKEFIAALDEINIVCDTKGVSTSKVDHNNHQSVMDSYSVLDNTILMRYENQYQESSARYVFYYQGDESEKQVQDILTVLKKFNSKEKNQIKLLIDNCGFLEFDSFDVKVPKVDLSLHYAEGFEDKHQQILEVLQTSKNGLILFHGEPGTGKTSYIKYLCSEQTRNIIFIPINLIERIGSPEFVQLMMNEKGSILIIEEAEQILLKRSSNEFKSAVSALLNITDGIMADLLNLAVICTFNTDLSNVDPALLRKGRTILRHEFKQLSQSQASKLAGKDVFRTMTLADAVHYQEEGYVKVHKLGF